MPITDFQERFDKLDKAYKSTTEEHFKKLVSLIDKTNPHSPLVYLHRQSNWEKYVQYLHKFREDITQLASLEITPEQHHFLVANLKEKIAVMQLEQQLFLAMINGKARDEPPTIDIPQPAEQWESRQILPAFR